MMLPVRSGHLYALRVALCLLLTSVAGNALGAVTLEQADGSTLILPRSAERVVTLAPNLAELLFAAGAGQKLKAVVEYSNFPAEVTRIPRVGDAFRLDLERIVNLDPDLVVAWQSGNPQAALQKLQSLGLKVLQIEILSPEDIADTVETLARATGTEDTGFEAAAHLRHKITSLRNDNRDKPVVDYFYQVATRPLYTVNGEHIISRGLELCGAKNVFADLASLAPQINRESVLLADPRVMIAADDGQGSRSLETWNEWPRMRAVAGQNMLYLPADQISQATPRFLDSIGFACDYFDRVRQSTGNTEKQ